MGLLDHLTKKQSHDEAEVATPKLRKRAASPLQIMIGPVSGNPEVDKMLRAGRYCAVLNDVLTYRTEDIAFAAKILDYEMSFVPAGQLHLQKMSHGGKAETELINEPSFFIDRDNVTNEQFKLFLDADGYRENQWWHEASAPYRSQFIDSTGVPAPASWASGNFPPEKARHPVVGVSWFEANAYATWAGKRLPTTTQWQRAGTWWNDGALFPWGPKLDRERINTPAAGRGDTASVDEYESSATPYGVTQLVGNVWEWIEEWLTAVEVNGNSYEPEESIGELRGGAFDTYFASQATCEYRGGQPLWQRNNNVGFRCAASNKLLIAMIPE